MAESKPTLLVNRRAFIKGTIAAGGGLIASAFLPEKWTKPVIRTGVLPVHAQTSVLYEIASTVALYDPGDGCLTEMSVTISPAADGVEMKADIVPSEQSGEPTTTLTATTTAGVATFTPPPCYGHTEITVTYRFGNSSLCTGSNCTDEYTFPND